MKLPHYPNRCPIFDIVILLEDIHDKNALSELNNDINISFLVKDNRISGTIEYSNYIFRNETINHLAKSYINILECVLSNVNIKISKVHLLKENDKNQLLKQFNDNTKKYPIEQTINRLFEKQVEQNPNKIAVIHQSSQVTYRELNARANKLARFLRNLGVRKRRVCKCFKRA